MLSRRGASCATPFLFAFVIAMAASNPSLPMEEFKKLLEPLTASVLAVTASNVELKSSHDSMHSMLQAELAANKVRFEKYDAAIEELNKAVATLQQRLDSGASTALPSSSASVTSDSEVGSLRAELASLRAYVTPVAGPRKRAAPSIDSNGTVAPGGIGRPNVCHVKGLPRMRGPFIVSLLTPAIKTYFSTPIQFEVKAKAVDKHAEIIFRSSDDCYKFVQGHRGGQPLSLTVAGSVIFPKVVHDRPLRDRRRGWVLSLCWNRVKQTFPQLQHLATYLPEGKLQADIDDLVVDLLSVDYPPPDAEATGLCTVNVCSDVVGKAGITPEGLNEVKQYVEAAQDQEDI